MYSNCVDYLKGELPELKPDIIVTQGNGAAWAVNRLFDVRDDGARVRKIKARR